MEIGKNVYLIDIRVENLEFESLGWNSESGSYFAEEALLSNENIVNSKERGKSEIYEK